MGLLAGVNYDPAVTASGVTTSLSAMAVVDNTNLRLIFNAPANGIVLVRIRTLAVGATTFPTILLGVMSGASVVARQAPLGGLEGTALAVTKAVQEALFCVSGLTPSAAYTWDAAMAVQVVVAATGIRWGGPNDTSAGTAWGGFQFEVWTADNCLGAKLYDPAVAVSKATTSLLAMTAIDTTNLRITFTAPLSGNVLVRMRAPVHGSTTFPHILFGVLDGATVRARVSPIGALKTTAVNTAQLALEGQAVVTGLTPGSSYTWDAAYGVEEVKSSTNLKYGGPNDASGNDAWGGFAYEIWGV